MAEETATRNNNASNDNAHTNKDETNTKGKKGPVTKEKLRSIMEAASALTSLGDEDSASGSRPSSPKPDEIKKEDDSPPRSSSIKRYIPEHKKPDAALTFPEKLMNMMIFATTHDIKKFCIAWLPDGKSFVIRNPDEFTRKVLPKFFKATKFSSFTRKLYRWGFRQVNRGIGPDDPIIFGNEYFQRDNAELMVKMRSITAAGTRKAQSLEAAQAEIEASRKRPFDHLEEQRKRMFIESLMQQKSQGYMGGDPSGLFGQASLQQSFNLASALRPSLGLNHHQQMVNNMKPLGLLNQFQPNSTPNPLNLYMNQQPQQQQQQPQQQQHQPTQPQQGPSSQLPHHPQQQPQLSQQAVVVQQQLQQLQQQQQQLQHQIHQQQYPTASTAEIVNAAINALKYAS